MLITENARNKQTINEKEKRKYKKGIDPEVNKIVSCGKKWEKIFHALQKIDMRTCYAKQKINLACPKTVCGTFHFRFPFVFIKAYVSLSDFKTS